MTRHARWLAAVWMAAALLSRIAVADIYDPPSNYYSAATGTGATLKSQLRTITSNMIGVVYGNARYSPAYTDVDPNTAGNILLIYNRASVSSVWDNVALPWNREHIWPQAFLGASASNGTANIASDQFNLRPADTDINNARANDAFGLDSSSGNHGPVGGYYYPGDADAGDVARSMFYMATRYSTLSLKEGVGTGTQMGDLSSLLNFHFKDVPDTFERRRNHAIYGLAGAGPAIANPYRQENRNPFVDHPEFAWSVIMNDLNDSQVTIDGASIDGSGGSTMNVDLGRVYVGANVPVAQDFMLNKSGMNGTYFEVTIAGDATSSLTGRYNAFLSSQTDSRSITIGLTTSTATSGIKSGTVTVDNLDITSGYDPANTTMGHAANDGNDVFNVSLAVLDHPVASFDLNAEERSRTIDFGTVLFGSGPFTSGASITNLAAAGAPDFAANLDLDSIMSSGDFGVFDTGLSTFAGLAQGDYVNFVPSFLPTGVGEFAAEYTIDLSDEDLPGEQSQTLSLVLTATAILGGDYNRDGTVNAADYTVWRDTLGTEVAKYEGADGSGNFLVDRDDFLVWKSHFGETASMGSGGAVLDPIAVPEPTAWLLAWGAIAAIGGLDFRRSKRG